MFKKAPQVKSSSNVKSSERRHLLVEICKQFGLSKENLTKDQELALLPAVTKQATYHSVQEHKGTIYFDGEEKPTWFRIRDSQLYPTVFTLWRAGHILPVVLTNPFVISRIVGNANLLLPGCIPPFDKRALRGALVGIASYNSPTVIKAIGTCSLNLTQFDDVQNRQGTAVTIIHRIEDELYNLFDDDVAIPESLESAFPPAPDSLRYLHYDSESSSADEESGDGQENGEEQENDTVSLEQTNADAADANPAEEPKESSPIEEPKHASPMEEHKEASPAEELADAVDELAVEDLDNFFLRSFVQSVKTCKIELPLSSSKFMADYVLKNLPRMDSKYANIKKTSWKKSAKFLKALEKMKYLSLKGKGDDVNIVEITVPQETLANFVTHKTIEASKGSGGASSKKAADSKMSVVSLYKPSSKSRAIFNKLGMDFQKLFTQLEIRDIVNNYVKVAELASKRNPKMVVLDSALSSATGISDQEVTRDKLYPAVVKNFSPNYTVLLPGKTLDSCVVKKGDPKKIKILTQTVLGRKKTTTVSEFEHFHIKAQTLAEDLKNKCSGSTSIGPSKHNPAVLEVMVQGPHGATIIEYLKDKGVPISFIDFEDKSKGKKKRSN